MKMVKLLTAILLVQLLLPQPIRGSQTFTRLTQNETANKVLAAEKTASTGPIHNDYTYHIIPHTHDDAGWLTSFEDYYTGDETPFKECVHCILDKILELLTAKPSRVFPYVEISFFERWYRDLSEFNKTQVKKLVENKQLYFSNAAWVMNDEACVYFEDVIEQYIIGHRWVFKEFNYIPTVGWSIDPFGHSATQPYLLAQMGINIAIFERINHKDVEKRKVDGTMEFVWVPFENFPEWNVIGHHNYMKYGSTQESGYCFPKNVCDAVDKSKNSIPTAAQWLQSQASMYGTKEILWQIGNDFTFSYNGTELYEAIEEFVDGVNNMSDPLFGRAILSTPEIYIDRWYEDYKKQKTSHLVIKNDDFFPYAEVPGWTREAGYWSGYFTSKPTLKWAIKDASWLLHTGRKVVLGAFLNMRSDEEKAAFVARADKRLDELERAVAINQHHDAVTGTSKKYTDADYMHMLNEGRAAVWGIIREVFHNETTEKLGIPAESASSLDFFRCNHNTSSIECRPLTESLLSNSDSSLLLKIYNSGSNKRIVHRVKVPHEFIEVFNASNKPQEHDLICAEDDYTNSGQPDCDLYINDFFPSYESRYYLLRRSMGEKNALIPEIVLKAKEEKTIELPFGSYFKILKDQKTYNYKFCDRLGRCIEDQFELDYKYYESVQVAQQSGAYIMRLESPHKRVLANSIQCSVFPGQYVTVIKIARNVTLKNNNFYYHGKHQIVTKLRLNNYDLTRGIEIDTYIDAIRVNTAKMELIGIEIALLIKNFRVKNQGLFKTDSNGLRMMTRSTDYHTDYPPDGTGHQVEANYYPVTAAISIEDPSSNLTLTILNDRSQGGTSQASGEIEIMIQRRTSRDDARGVGEAMMDTEIVKDYLLKKPKVIGDRLRTIHHYQLSDPSSNFFLASPNLGLDVPSNFRAKQIEADTKLITTYTKIPIRTFPEKTTKEFEYTQKREALPASVKVSARVYSPSEIFVRLANLNDAESVDVSLVDREGNINILTYISGMKSRVENAKVEEVALNTIITKEQALRMKFELRETGKFDIDSLLIKGLEKYYTNDSSLISERDALTDEMVKPEDLGGFETNKSTSFQPTPVKKREFPKYIPPVESTDTRPSREHQPPKIDTRARQEESFHYEVMEYYYLVLALKILGLVGLICLIIYFIVRISRLRGNNREFNERIQLRGGDQTIPLD